MEILDDNAIAHIANYFQVLAEPMRLRVLNTLRSGEHNVGELAEHLGCTTANISKHLSLLAKGGFVERETRGNSAYYRIADSAIFDLCDLVCGQVGKRLAGQAEMAARMVSVREKLHSQQ
jgi:DNA-binding transcriptional ArsR family regulator